MTYIENRGSPFKMVTSSNFNKDKVDFVNKTTTNNNDYDVGKN